MGVARYVRITENAEVAELAVAVVDAWQRRGVGTHLTSALADRARADRARAEGVKRFSALVLADNELMLSLLDYLGIVRVLRREAGTVELTVGCPGKISDTFRGCSAPSLARRSGHSVTRVQRAEGHARRAGRCSLGAAAQRHGNERDGEHGKREHGGQIDPERARSTRLPADVVHRVDGVGHRHHVGDGVQDRGELPARHEQPQSSS